MNTNSVPGIIKAIKILWQTCCVSTIEIVGNTLYIHNEPSLITVDVIYLVLLPFRQSSKNGIRWELSMLYHFSMA